jgi:hypothetical protein
MRLILVGGVFLVSSCAWFGEKPVETAGNSTPRLVGRVAHVPAGADFVLIEAYGPWRVPDGGLLSGVGTEGRTANLVSTGEKLGQHAAADIRSGVAKVGDSVYYRPLGGGDEEESVVSPAPERTTPEIEAQKNEAGSPAMP